MAENNNVIQSDPATEPSNSIGARIKEWFRKQIVALKRKPQNIAMLFLVVTTIYFLLILFKISQAVNSSNANAHTYATGICMFIVTLLSILILVSFLNAFPKRKKPAIAFIILVFAMIAGMIICDIVYYIQMSNCMAGIADKENSDMYSLVSKAQPYVLGHIILLGVSAIVFALLPVYSRLINMIDTSVKVASATENMRGEIDLRD